MERWSFGTSEGNVVIIDRLWFLLDPLDRSKMMENVMCEHTRTCNKVHFSPLDANLLASGSQVNE